MTYEHSLSFARYRIMIRGPEMCQKSPWYRNCYCDRSGTGEINCENKWTQDFILDLLKANNPKLQCFKNEDYVEYKYFSVKFSYETKFKDEDKMKIIKKALTASKIKVSEKSIIERPVPWRTWSHGHGIKHFCLLENSVANTLNEKGTIAAATEKLTLQIIKPIEENLGIDCFIHEKPSPKPYQKPPPKPTKTILQKSAKFFGFFG